MDLNELIRERAEMEEERLDRLQGQLDAVFSDLAAIAGHADFSLFHCGDEASALRDAFEVLRNQIVHLLDISGVQLVGKPGEIIDPAKHMVVEARQGESAGVPMVAAVHEYGALNTRDGRLLRRAQVVASIPTNGQRD